MDWTEMNPAQLQLLQMAAQTEYEAAQEKLRPCVVFRPRIFIDGNQWCALYGENLQDGVAGFGNTPDAAMRAFDSAWYFPVQDRPPAQSNNATHLHGFNCPKAPHGLTGYLHSADDDTPYDVDGVAYCGRCHRSLEAVRPGKMQCPKCG